MVTLKHIVMSFVFLDSSVNVPRYHVDDQKIVNRTMKTISQMLLATTLTAEKLHKTNFYQIE